MSAPETHAERTPHDLSHLVFSSGEIGRLQTLSTIPVIAGDSFEQNLVGAMKLSPLRRGLAVDSVMDVFTFYVPHRHIYGKDWMDLIRLGRDSAPIDQRDLWTAGHSEKMAHLGVNMPKNYSTTVSTPKWLKQGYLNIYNNYFKMPYNPDVDYGTDHTLAKNPGLYGLVCMNLKSIWTTPLPPRRNGSIMTLPAGDTSATLNLTSLTSNFALLHTQQERELFMQRYRDVIKKQGGSTHEDSDNRPRLLMRTTQWASGYDVDGTTETTLGQHTGRVSQSFNHKVPRAFIPEHGVIWTVALNRFPPVHTAEQHYLIRQSSVRWQDYAGDPAVIGNSDRQTIGFNAFFPQNAGGPQFDIPMGQWLRYHPNTVHSNYANLQGYPFLTVSPTTIAQAEQVNPASYDSCFQTTQLGHWNMQAKNNVSILRTMPNARDSIMTS